MSDKTSPKESRETAEASFSQLLCTKKFLCLMAAVFLAYANISVFFGFYDHLRTLQIDPADYGTLIGALAAVALVLRPVISPFFHADNARFLLYLGTTLAAASLAAYSLATGFWSMLLVRMLHGISFAVVGSALMALIVEVIPTKRSAQFFGYLAVVTLIPNTLVPPLLPFLDPLLGGFNRILLLFALLTLCIFPLIQAVGGSSKEGQEGRKTATALMAKEILVDLQDLRVLGILFCMLMLYCGNALIFFFLDGYGKSIGLMYAGVFLTLSTVGEISVRIVAGGVFDRLEKVRVAAWSLAALAFCYLILAHIPGKGAFIAIGLFFGLGWGIAMPIFNGLMFDVSQPRFRAFNINLGLQMFQAGFFLGPIIGAPVLAEWGYTTIFHLSAGMSLLAAIVMTMQQRKHLRADWKSASSPE
jgi:predicted MFS family arabinose efflux permease